MAACNKCHKSQHEINGWLERVNERDISNKGTLQGASVKVIRTEIQG